MAAHPVSAAPFRLAPADAERYARLRLRMLREAPHAFGASPEDDAALDLAHLPRMLAEAESAIVAVDDGAGGELRAAAGIVRQKRAKSAHRAALWGVYVAPEARGAGLGRAVTEAAIGLARGWAGEEWVQLGVSAEAPAARALYERLGFRVWGREPEAMVIDGRRIDELHLALPL